MDSLKCPTVAVSPAKPGDFPLLVNPKPCGGRGLMDHLRRFVVGAYRGPARGLMSSPVFALSFSLLGFRAYQRDYLGPDVVQLGGGHLPFA